MSKKKKKGNRVSAGKAFGRYVKQAARKLPIKECFAVSGWTETGITQIIVAREKPSGAILVGEYLVDLYCLGLKESGGRIYDDNFQYEEFLGRMNDYRDFEPIDAQLAFNIIYGAIEYAEDIGFEPHSSFDITEYILDDVDEVEFIEIEFGKNGKPFYSSMPYDNVEKIMATLYKNVGEGNFNFLARVADESEYEEESDEEIETRIVAFFPEDRINKKLDTLEEEDRIRFKLYISAAEVLLDMSNGHIDILEEFLKEENFFEDALEVFTEKVSDDEVEKTDHEKKAIQKFLTRNLTYISEKLLQYGDLEFLLEDDFYPTPKLLTNEGYGQMTDEDIRKYEKRMYQSMTIEESNQYIFRNFFLHQMLSDEEDGVAIPMLGENIDEYYNKVFLKLNDSLVSKGEIGLEEQKDEIRIYFDEAIENYWKTELRK